MAIQFFHLPVTRFESPATPTRRKCLAAAGTLTGVSVAGCTDLIFGDELEFEASYSRVAQSALDDTGYELDDRTDQVIEQTVEAGGESQDVVVTNKLVEYHNSIDMGPLGQQEGAIFTSLTTPQVRVLGQEFNPIDEMETDEIAQMIQEEYDEVENLREDGSSEVVINDEPVTQTRYLADGVFEGSPAELAVHISEAVEMGDDFVVGVGVYPRSVQGIELPLDEEANILSLMEAIEPDD